MKSQAILPMPNRDVQDANGYRYAYQGQEKDPETGKEAFELRLWDGRIGRWLTTDPAGQYHSPYLGMNNNPISVVDPDGGEGEDDFKLDKKTGEITKIRDTNDNFDRLFATDENGNINSNATPLKVNKANPDDETIISEVANNEADHDKYTGQDTEPINTKHNYGVSTNKHQTFKFFKYVAKNSNVEWSVNKFSIGKQVFYLTGTYHRDDLSPNLTINGKAFAPGSKFLGIIHSHPLIQAHDITSRDQSIWGDKSTRVRSYNNNKPYLIYFPFNNTTLNIKIAGKKRDKVRLIYSNGLTKF